MRDGLKKLIKDYLKAEYPRIIHKGELGRKAVVEWNFENENCGRRLRELETAGVIEVIYNEKREAQYRFKPRWLGIGINELRTDLQKKANELAREQMKQSQMFDTRQRVF